MKEGIQIAVGIACLFAAFVLWKDHADQIAKSRAWALGWALYMVLIITAGKCLGPLLDGLPINDDVAVPCILVGAGLLCLAIGLYHKYRFHRLRKARHETHFR